MLSRGRKEQLEFARTRADLNRRFDVKFRIWQTATQWGDRLVGVAEIADDAAVAALAFAKHYAIVRITDTKGDRELYLHDPPRPGETLPTFEQLRQTLFKWLMEAK